MDKNEEKNHMETGTCEHYHINTRTYLVSYQWGGIGCITDCWVCGGCLDRLRRLAREGKIRYVILQRTKPTELPLLGNDYER